MTDQPQTTSQTTTEPASGTPASFDEWIGKQPAEVQALYTAHTTGLHNTVKATRDERDTLAKQIKDLLPKAEKGSELERTLTDLSGKLEASERRAQFVEEAIKPEIGCRNPKAAYALALSDNLFDRKGQPDWQSIKQAAPELFGAAGVNANAGNGTQNQPVKTGMNEFIRRAAGRS